MKSMNIKRVAAVAAGAAMVGSIFASGFAAVTPKPTQTDVSTLVGQIAANLDDAAVVLGSQGADISDGISAAKIAAALALADFTAASSTACTVANPTITVEKSGAVETTSSTTSLKELTNDSAQSNTNFAYESTMGNSTWDRTYFTGLLKQSSLTINTNASLSTSATSHTYYYEDKIIAYQSASTQSKYDENTAGTTGTEHGVYYASPWGTSGTQGVVYQVDFGTEGPYIGTNVSYSEIPTIKVAGQSIGIDYKNTAVPTTGAGTLKLVTGSKKLVKEGDTLTAKGTVDYTVTIDTVSQVSSTAGVTYAIGVTVSDGTTTSQQTINDGNTEYFFDNDISIYAEKVLGGTKQAYIRVSTGLITLNRGTPWIVNVAGATTADKRKNAEWTVAEILGSADSKLQSIKLVYGNSEKAGMQKSFDGTYSTGLAKDVKLNGPLKEDGTPYFSFWLKGFGSLTTTVSTTPVHLKAMGSDGSDYQLIQATWISRDGRKQAFEPTDRRNVNFGRPNITSSFQENLTGTPGVGGNAAGGGSVNLSVAYPKNWLIINDKVVYVDSATLDGQTGLFSTKFVIGGPNGANEAATLSGFNGTTGTVWTFSSTANPIRCNVTAYAASDIGIGWVAGDTMAANTIPDDTSTGRCDVVPNLVPFGYSSEIDNKIPWMNLVNTIGNTTPMNSSGVGILDNGVGRSWPWVFVAEPNSATNMAGGMLNYTIVYDSNSTDTNNQYTGFRVFKSNVGATNVGYPLTDVFINWTNTTGSFGAATSLIDWAKSTVYDSDKYHITPLSTELSTTDAYNLDLVVPEQSRNLLLAASTEAAAGGVVGETYKVGDTIASGVKLTAINCAATGGGTGLYTMAKTFDPKSLVVLDTPTPTKQYLVVVGGPWVNRLAQGFADKGLVEQAGAQYLVAEGKKLLVAGYTATDTAAAADSLIDLLSQT